MKLIFRDLWAFSGVILPIPSFGDSSNIFSAAQSLAHIENMLYG